MPQSIQNASIPAEDPLVNDAGFITSTWNYFLSNLLGVAAAAASLVNRTGLAAQAASIAPTDVSGGAISAGLYRVSYYARVTQPATTSSGLVVSILWLDHGVTLQWDGPAVTGNITSAFDQGTVFVYSDGPPIDVAVAYSSSGATPMQYELYVTVERVSA